ncbi:hypothetical protein T484DRAFT_1812374 [Baffinella frigidus]|nr:hypothetical protein T484DRAFT_1812374 [Cryptophyta sp. CCMP2293]
MAFVMRRRVALLLVSAAVITGLTGGAGRTRSGEAGRAIPWGCRENGIPHGDSARTGGRSACGAGRLDKICLERGVSGEAALDGAGGLSLRLRGGRMVSMPEKYYKKRKALMEKGDREKREKDKDDEEIDERERLRIGLQNSDSDGGPDATGHEAGHEAEDSDEMSEDSDEVVDETVESAKPSVGQGGDSDVILDETPENH